MIMKRISSFGIALSVALSLTVLSYAATTNPVPYSESFEGWAVGSNLLNTGHDSGWYGDPLSTAFATNVSYAAAWTNTYPATNTLFPIQSAAHAKVVAFTNAAMSNVFANYTGPTNTIVDFMMSPARSPDVPDAATIASAQTVLYVDASGYLNAWHRPTYTTTNWATFTTKTFDASGTNWARASLVFDYATSLTNFFKVTLNGVDQVPASGGHTKSGNTFTPGGGVWMIAVNQSSPRKVGAFGINGNGGLDDLVVTTNTSAVNYFSYDLVASSGPNGTITPTSTNVNAGSSPIFTVIATNSNFRIADIKTNGATVNGGFGNDSTNVTWTWSNVQSTGFVYSTFTYRQFPMTVNAGANGTITPGTFSANAGSNVTFTIAANPNYCIAGITTNGGVLGWTYGNNSLSTNFTWTNIQAAGTIAATFARRVFHLTATAGPEGTISPLSTDVNAGDAQVFNIAATTAFYRVCEIITSAGVTNSSFDNSTRNYNYTWSNVQADGWLTVSFTNQIERGSIYKMF